MNEPRHKTYRRVKALVRATGLESDERWRLVDAAEGLLLSRTEEEAEAGRLRSSARATLLLAVVRGRLSATAAGRMMALIERCGPPSAATGA